MLAICTMFDRDRVTEGLVCIDSIRKHAPDVPVKFDVHTYTGLGVYLEPQEYTDWLYNGSGFAFNMVKSRMQELTKG